MVYRETIRVSAPDLCHDFCPDGHDGLQQGCRKEGRQEGRDRRWQEEVVLHKQSEKPDPVPRDRLFCFVRGINAVKTWKLIVFALILSMVAMGCTGNKDKGINRGKDKPKPAKADK
jgi:hypothetical protein